MLERGGLVEAVLRREGIAAQSKCVDGEIKREVARVAMRAGQMRTACAGGGRRQGRRLRR